MKKKSLAALLALGMVLGMAACGGSGSGQAAPSGSADSGSADGKVSFTIFNSKTEIEEYLEEAAAKYGEEHGVNVEVYYSSDTVAAHMSTRYASGQPYTLNMVDAKDVYSLGVQYGYDMTGAEWIDDTDYAISVDGKVMGFPVCIEARGVMYNADAIEKITGQPFDPASCATLDGFKACIDALKAGGMDAPVGVMKEDWSLAAHYFQEIYEQREDPESFIQALYAGTADLANDAKFNSMMDTFDVLMANNYAADSPVAAEREVSEQKLAEGEIAFMFGGNWDWSLIKDYNAEANLGMMPVPQNTDDGSNEKLVGGGSKYFFIDSSENTSEEQVAAAKDFLNWLVSDPEGNAFLTEKCAVVPAYDNIDASALDPLSKSVKEYADKGALIDNYNYDPDDHYSIVGAAMQKYLAGQIDRAGFAAEVEAYWAGTTPVEH